MGGAVQTLKTSPIHLNGSETYYLHTVTEQYQLDPGDAQQIADPILVMIHLFPIETKLQLFIIDSTAHFYFLRYVADTTN